MVSGDPGRDRDPGPVDRGMARGADGVAVPPRHPALDLPKPPPGPSFLHSPSLRTPNPRPVHWCDRPFLASAPALADDVPDVACLVPQRPGVCRRRP